jgi:hypothetical protein
VRELREYFRKPGKSGSWDDHVYRYSKSRRKAPIYWLLQSAKKNYALWLYYHRFDKDPLLPLVTLPAAAMFCRNDGAASNNSHP